MTWTLRSQLGGGDVLRSDLPRVQRSGDECAVTTGPHEPLEIAGPPNTAAGKQGQVRNRQSDRGNRIEVESHAAADAREIEHDDGAGAGIGGAGRDAIGRVSRRDAAACDHRLAVAQVQAEGDAAAVRGVADGPKRCVGGERLETHDHLMDSQRQQPAGAIDRRHAGVHPQRRSERGERGDDSVLRRARQDGVEVRDVELPKAEPDDIRSGQRERVAPIDPRPSDHVDRRVLTAHSPTRMHRQAAAQIHHPDYTHRGSTR